MATEKQIRANRANAKRSSGPKTVAGRLTSSRNSFRHGLSLPLSADPQTQAKIERLATTIAGTEPTEQQLVAAMMVAEAQVDIIRIRTKRAETTPTLVEAILNQNAVRNLCALDRYERLAMRRRKLASRRFDDLAGND
jgi:hypothetical protein